MAACLTVGIEGWWAFIQSLSSQPSTHSDQKPENKGAAQSTEVILQWNSWLQPGHTFRRGPRLASENIKAVRLGLWPCLLLPLIYRPHRLPSILLSVGYVSLADTNRIPLTHVSSLTRGHLCTQWPVLLAQYTEEDNFLGNSSMLHREVETKLRYYSELSYCFTWLNYSCKYLEGMFC